MWSASLTYMAYWLPKPITGHWPWRTFPESVEFAGRVYERARFWALDEPRVLAQYRSVECERSWHMKVRSDYTYVIDHVDAANPSCGPGHAARHLVQDVPSGGAWALLLLGGAVVLGGFVVAALARDA